MIAALAVLLIGLQEMPPSEAEIELAIKKGVKALILRVQEDPSGAGPASVGLNYDHNALVLYTLVHSGTDLQGEVVQALLKRALEAPLMRIYQVALTAAALAAIDPWKHQGRLSQCAQYLVDWQCDNGQWSYGDKYEPPVKTSPNDGGANRTIAKVQIKRGKKLGGAAGDNSNSQYAALGLKAVSAGGCEIDPAVLNKAIEWLEKSQQKNGGWSYHLDGVYDSKLGTYGSMTAGAVSALIMLKQLKGSDPKVMTAVTRGMTWLAEHFTVEKNADCPPGSEDWHHYYLYALERVGDLLPTEKIGKRPWYAIGATYLVKSQRSDGCWRGSNPGMLIADTCFSLLFLERVARRPPVMTGGKNPPPPAK